MICRLAHNKNSDYELWHKHPLPRHSPCDGSLLFRLRRYVFAAGDDPSRLTAGPVLFFLGSICIALYCTAATIIRQIIGTYTAAAKYLFPAIGYAVAAMTVICGLFIIQSHMTGALVTGM